MRTGMRQSLVLFIFLIKCEIKCDGNVTLLGVNIDFMLSFDDYLTNICKKKSFKTTGSFKMSWKILKLTG